MAIDWQAFCLTLQLAITVSAILLVLGLPIAHWIAFSHRRWKFLIEAVVALPICASADGAGVLRSGSARAAQPTGSLVDLAHRPHVGFHVQRLVIGFNPLQSAVCGAALCRVVRRRRSQADRGFGDSGRFPAAHFFRVIMPLSVPGLITGTALSFAHTMGEFGSCSWWAETFPV